MGEGSKQTIEVGEISRGENAGESVELPVVDVLTGRAFVTGKSGSGKSNTASVVAEKLLDRQFGVLIVDIDGEYYGLKEEYEILHVGGDEECDLQVGVEHAEKIADLALEKNVPIILDVSSFLDESKARKLLTAVARQLFSKEKKHKQPFLLLVEEIHEYVPEGGGMDECGRMLIKVSKRGRKHGLGIVGISQRPADVKKDFITQCDWLVWHRLTWDNDTKVVGRVLGNDYADYVEELDDGESFLMTDWNEEIKPVQFERKRTFDAGATPGLDDFERPDLKSVSGDLVSELESITDEQRKRDDRIEELQRQLQKKEERIRDLERQLSEARDLERMADRFSRAMAEYAAKTASVGGSNQRLEAVKRGDAEPKSSPVPDAAAEWEERSESAASADGTRQSEQPGSDGAAESGDSDSAATNRAASGTRPESTDEAGGEGGPNDDESEATESGDLDGEAVETTETSDPSSEPAASEFGVVGVGTAVSDGEFEVDDRSDTREPTADAESDPEDAIETAVDVETTGDPFVDRLRREIAELDEEARSLLWYYREHGPVTPQEAHEGIGGSGNRTDAYALNHRLRRRGLVEHVARGRHDYALPELVATERDPVSPLESDPQRRQTVVSAVEAAFLDDASIEASLLDDDGTKAASD